MKILITGGAGYIGSHTILELIDQGYTKIYSIDNYLNSREECYRQIEQISGFKVDYFNIDLSDLQETEQFFSENDIDAVIHFAALKSVPESVEKPLECYHNNINSLLNLMSCMEKYKVNRLIFSSSCSVYGNPEYLPVDENTPFGKAESPYAFTKQIGENIIRDFCKVNPDFKAISLRYFNPAGAHSSGLIGEIYTDRPSNLVPIITQTAAGMREKMKVFGTDYNTKDGSCIRDYIHVSDVADAHVKALLLFENMPNNNYEVINVGTGKGTSVLEIIQSFEKTSGQQLNYELSERRAGDVESIYADNKKVTELLEWKANYSIDDMTSSAWKWQQNMKV